MARLEIVLLFVAIGAASSKPVEDNTENAASSAADESSSGHSLWKRFINPSQTFGALSETGGGIAKMRTKRGSEEECERLNLCKLHARSRHNFFSAFELYFVNKENAKLWDHRARSMADCHRRFGDCYER